MKKVREAYENDVAAMSVSERQHHLRVLLGVQSRPWRQAKATALGYIPSSSCAFFELSRRVLLACISGHCVHPRFPLRLEEGIGFSETKITDGCGPPCGVLWKSS